MALKVTIHEALALKQLQGTIRVEVRLQEGSKQTLPQATPPCAESAKPTWSDAEFSFDTYGYDTERAVISITVLSGGEDIGKAEVPLRSVIDNPHEYQERKL